MIKEIGALSFQILNNLKIVTAAILFQLVLKKNLTPVKWRAVVLLTFGSLISQLKDCISDGGTGFHGSAGGYVAQQLTCWLSAAASIFCEVMFAATEPTPRPPPLLPGLRTHLSRSLL